MLADKLSDRTEFKNENEEEKIMTEVALANPEDNNNLPAFMTSERPEGLENVSRYQSRQVLKILQPTSQIEMADEFGVGSVITKPGEILIAKKGEEFTATAMGFSPSAQKCADYNDKAIEGKFDEVFNPAHSYFAKAEDRNRRIEQYGPNGEFKREYVLALNYALLIRGGDLDGELVQLTYSRGSGQIGRNINGLIRRRGRDGVSIFGNTFKFYTSLETKGGNSWFIMNYRHIPDWVETEEMYLELRQMNKEIEAGWKALRESGTEPPETPSSELDDLDDILV